MLRYKEKRWDSKRMLDSGGMPSSHSATVMALVVAVGLQDGTGGPNFAIAVVLACVVSDSYSFVVYIWVFVLIFTHFYGCWII